MIKDPYDSVIIGYPIESACLICGEGIPNKYNPAICEKCKEAVMEVRIRLERELWAPEEPD